MEPARRAPPPPAPARARAAAALGLALVVGACGDPAPAPAPAAPRPPIVLVTLDTTRADRIGAYGYARDTTPNLDRLCATATRYTRATSPSSWTLPAHASLFTGKLPSSHGARYDERGPLVLTDAITGEPAWDGYRARGLAVGETTLAGRLAAAGYRTGGVVGGPWMKAVFGLGRGFETWDDDGIEALNGRLADAVTDAAIAWLERDDGRPPFLFVNYYDPHFPYAPPREHAERYLGRSVRDEDVFDERVMPDLYDGELRFMDAQLGRLLDALRARGLFDDAWIVVTADHGELLGEDGRLGHGETLTQEEIHVPLIVKAPGQARGRVEAGPAQLHDVAPTLLAALGLEAGAAVQGEVLPDVRHPVVAELYPLEAFSERGDWRVLITGDLKYSWSSRGVRRLVDLSTAPHARRDLAPSRPEQVERLDTALHGYLDALPPPGEAGPVRVLDEDTRAALDALGYLR